MRLIVMGTGPFCVPSFEALCDSPHDVLKLITRPIPDPGRRRKSPPNPMREAAESLGIEIAAPENVNDAEFVEELRALAADLMVVCDYGQILSKECLAVTRKGGINLHGSLLPKYRGAAPVNWAVYHGEAETGITVIHMSPRLDAGPCLAKRSTPIEHDEDAVALEARLARLGVEPVFQAIELLSEWDGQRAIGEIQDPKLATKARRLRKEDAVIDWRRSALQIHNQIRAFQPWPGTYSVWNRTNGKPLRLIFHSARIAEAVPDDAEPGTVYQCDKNEIRLACGEGGIVPIDVQVPGKKRMPIADVLRGYAIQRGDRFTAS